MMDIFSSDKKVTVIDSKDYERTVEFFTAFVLTHPQVPFDLLCQHGFFIPQALQKRLTWLEETYRLQILLFVLTKEFEIALSHQADFVETAVKNFRIQRGLSGALEWNTFLEKLEESD